MFPVRRKLFAFALALVAACASAGAADGGWVTFKNDTGKPIQVQEFVTINGKKVSGKPTKLLAVSGVLGLVTKERKSTASCRLPAGGAA